MTVAEATAGLRFQHTEDLGEALALAKEIRRRSVPLASSILWVVAREASTQLSGAELTTLVREVREALTELPAAGYADFVRLSGLLPAPDEDGLRKTTLAALAVPLLGDEPALPTESTDDEPPLSLFGTATSVQVVSVGLARALDQDLPHWRSLPAKDRCRWCDVADAAVEDARSLLGPTDLAALEDAAKDVRLAWDEASAWLEPSVVKLFRQATWRVATAGPEPCLGGYVVACAEVHACLRSFAYRLRPAHLPRYFPKLDKTVDSLVRIRLDADGTFSPHGEARRESHPEEGEGSEWTRT